MFRDTAERRQPLAKEAVAVLTGVCVGVAEGEEVHPAELLKENAVWVIEKKHEYDAYREDVPERTYEEGEVFPFFGDEVPMDAGAAQSAAVVREMDTRNPSKGRFRL